MAVDTLRTDDSAPLSDETAERLVDRLVAEMADAFRSPAAGRGPRAEELLQRHPELERHPQAAVRLIYEEYCLRQERGETPDPAQVGERFPRWRNELAVLLDCHDLLHKQTAAPRFPAVGEDVDDFHLVAELGRGAMGRVFLARQTSLGDRPVVLKMTPLDSQEHLSLGRLQNTHIVPLFAAFDFPDRNIRALCMPFLGVVTFADALKAFGSRPVRDRRSGDLQRILDDASRRVPIPLPPKGETDFLDRFDYSRAVCWMVAQLAEAMDYAHRRGLIHLDLKPSNLLLGPDGQPLILDFHLARQPVKAGDPSPEWLGGTVGYMSPELHAAIEAVKRQAVIPGAVDERSDIYSLGLVLFDALGGSRDAAGMALVGELRARNPGVSHGLADIVARCLERDPGKRYPRAALLAEDLRRHCEDRPLKGVPNRSWYERWRKWRRRRPLMLPLLLVAAGLVSAMVAVADSTLTQWKERREGAEAALELGREKIREGKYAEAIPILMQGQDRAEGLWDSALLAEGLDRHLRIARRGDKAEMLQKHAHWLRFYSVTGTLSARGWLYFDAGCRQIWKERDVLADARGAQLGQTFEERIRTDLLDIAVLWGRLRVQRAGKQAETARRQALQVLQEAEELLGDNHVLAVERLAHARALGDQDLAPLERSAAERPPHTAWDFYALGRIHLQEGEVEEANGKFEQARRRQPMSSIPHYYLAICALRQGRYQDAISSLSYCLGREARPEWLYFRAKAQAASGNPGEAFTDLNMAAVVDPNLSLVFLERALLHRDAGRWKEAAADLATALDKGADPAAVHYEWAVLHLAGNDLKAARASVAEALRHDPAHPESLKLRGKLGD